MFFEGIIYWIIYWSKLTHITKLPPKPHSIWIIVLLIECLDVVILSIAILLNEHLEILGLTADSRLPMLTCLIALGSRGSWNRDRFCVGFFAWIDERLVSRLWKVHKVFPLEHHGIRVGSLCLGEIVLELFNVLTFQLLLLGYWWSFSLAGLFSVGEDDR